MRKLIIFLLVFILMFSSLSSGVLSKNEEINNEPAADGAPDGIIKNLLQLRFTLGSMIQGLSRYSVLQLRPPVAIQAYPESINLTYNKKMHVEIGGKNPETGEWEKMIKIAGPWSWGWMNSIVRYSFEVASDDNTSEDILKILNIRFDPEILKMEPNRNNLNWPGAEAPFKTNMTISLNPNIDPSVIPEDFVLKINVIREEAIDKIGILRGVPDCIKNNHDEYLEKEKELGIKNPYFAKKSTILLYNLLSKYFIFFMNARLPLYDKWVDSTVNVLVKIDKFHIGEIKPVPLVKIKPYEVKSIPISVINRGSHIYTYNFRVKYNNDNENFIITPPSSITLKPEEEKQIYVGVAAPKRFYSPGAITPITIEAYSVDDPNAMFSNTIVLQTSGVHVAGGPVINYGMILLVLLLGIILYVYIRKRYKGKINIFKQIKKVKIKKIKKGKTDKKHLGKEEGRVKEKKKPLMVEKKIGKSTSVVKALVDKNREKELREKERLMLKLKREQEKQKKRMRI